MGGNSPNDFVCTIRDLSIAVACTAAAAVLYVIGTLIEFAEFLAKGVFEGSSGKDEGRAQ